MQKDGSRRSHSTPGGMRWTGRQASAGLRVAKATIFACLASVVIVGCGGAEPSAGPPEEDPIARIAAPEDADGVDDAELPGALAISPTSVLVTTYEGSGELVHPDVAFFARGFWSYRYWFAATPYPGGDARFENPSVFNGASSVEMQVPHGLANPLAKPSNGAYLSDPDISFDPDRQELRMYYRQTLPNADQIYLVKSANGLNWSAGQLVIEAPRYSLISPAIVREGTANWRMWTVDATSGGCRSSAKLLTLAQRRSTNGVSWGPVEPVNLKIPHRVPWHWDVQYVRAKSEYWAMVAAYPDGTDCSHTAVYFARSVDGTTWDVSPSPLLQAGDFYPIQDLVYRSTFRYHEGSDAVSVWFSGARMENSAFKYSVAMARYPMDELLRRVNTVAAGSLDRGAGRRPTAELRAARAAFVADFP